VLTVKVIDTLDQVIADVNWSSASASHNLMEPGGWEVVADGDPALFLLLESRSEPLWVLLIDHETGHVHGGPLREVLWRGVTGDAYLVLSGGNANWLANTTVTLPDVGQTFYPGTPARSSRGYERAAQAGSRSIYELVDDQLNNTGLTYRNIDNSLVLASLSNTGLIIALESEPFEPLLDTIRRWGLRSGVIADFQWRGATATLELNLRLPTIRTFRLWEQDGLLLDWEYFESGDTLNHTWMGGSGEGVNRTVVPVTPPNGVPGKWGVTIERFVNGSSVEFASELVDVGQVEIENNRASQGISASARSVGSTLRFSADYQLGDICSTVFHGVEFFQVASAVEIDWRRSGKTEKLTTGEPDLFMFNTTETLGRQAAVTITPTGLAVGEVSLASVFTPGDAVVSLELGIVWARTEVNVFDQATWSIEQQIDGGGWVTVTGPTTTGSTDVSYESRFANVAAPAFTTSLEYRGVLAQAGEATVTSPALLLSGSATVTVDGRVQPNSDRRVQPNGDVRVQP